MSLLLASRRHGILGKASLWAGLLACALSGPGGGAVRAGAGAPANAPEVSPPSLLIVTIDTWRWDYLGASGSGKVETPNLDRLAREGVYEPEAVTPCPLTTPAHASLMTGLEPPGHGIWDCTRYRLSPDALPLAEVFRAGGFGTAAFVASETLHRRFGLDRGFELYDESGVERRQRGDWMTASRDGAAVTGSFRGFLRAQDPDRRLLVWVHYFDLHLPYRPRPALAAKYPKDPYAAQVAFVDGQVGELLSILRGDSRRSWRILVVGDHGEALGERGELTHGIGLYRSTVHVPLILYPRPDRPLAHPKPWGLVDLAPTLREWFSLVPASRCDGESLFRGRERARPLVAASVEPTLLFGVQPSIALREGRFQYLRSSREELYDLGADPDETRDLARQPEARDTLRTLRTDLDRAWPPTWLPAALPPAFAPTSEELRSLQSLGYISGAASPDAKVHRADIGEILKDRSDWERANEEAFRTRRDDGLLTLFARLTPKYPGSFALRKAYGTLLVKTGNTPEAVRQLEGALRLNPRDAACLTNLGGLYLSQNRPDSARQCLEGVLQLDPDNMVAHKNLGVLYADYLGDPGKAVLHYKRYLEAGGDGESDRIRMYIEGHEQTGRERPPH